MPRPSTADTFLFDAMGYFVVPGALTHDEVAKFNDVLDRLDPESEPDLAAREAGMVWLFNLDRVFVDLIDNPTVLPFLVAWVDDKVRLDQAYGLVHLPGEGAEQHGGPDDVGRGGIASYSVAGGRVSSGMTVVAYSLTDTTTGGGFRCVPGSHKSSFRVDHDVCEAAAVGVPVAAGDAVIFTEALVHGSKWRGPGSRRTLIVKYAPGTVGYLSAVWRDDQQEGLTERQRQLVLPPYAFDTRTRSRRQAIQL